MAAQMSAMGQHATGQPEALRPPLQGAIVVTLAFEREAPGEGSIR